MKVLLASASYPTPFTFHRKFLGLGYIHANAISDPFISKNVEIEHTFHHTRKNTVSQIAEEIVNRSPDLLGFACYVWNSPDVLKIASQIKRIAPKMKILLGGPEVDYEPLVVLEKNRSIDFVSQGEGEENFRELLVALLQSGDPGDVPGIAVQGERGPYLRAIREPSDNLDIFPSPYLEGVLDIDEQLKGAYFQTTRGCPFNCAYCDYGRNRPCNEFSFERAAAEIRFFKDHGVEKLFCVDSTFNLKKDRAVKMLNLMADISLNSALWIEAHPSLLNEEFVEAVGRTYLTYLGLGLQTINPEAMKNINRKWDPDKTGALLDRMALHKSCLLGLEIIMGLPGDDLASFKDAISWIYKRNVTNVFAFNLEVLPQTGLQKNKEKFEIVEGGPESSHEIVSNITFKAEQILVGKAITEWNRQLQPFFFRLARITGRPAGDLIEAWAWKAYEAGLHQHLTDLHNNNVEAKLLNRIADLCEASLKELFANSGVLDVSFQMREFLRYYYTRRSVTSSEAVFIDALDVHCITIDPKYNRILKKGDIAPPADAVRVSFAFDMKKIWPLTDAAQIHALPQEEHTYFFFSDVKGSAVAVED